MPVAIYSALLSKKPRLNGAHPIRNYFKSSIRKYTGRWSCGDWQRLQRRHQFLKRGAAGKACVYIVPPLELVSFAELPAEQDDTTITQRGEIYQAAFEIF